MGDWVGDMGGMGIWMEERVLKWVGVDLEMEGEALHPPAIMSLLCHYIHKMLGLAYAK